MNFETQKSHVTKMFDQDDLLRIPSHRLAIPLKEDDPLVRAEHSYAFFPSQNRDS